MAAGHDVDPALWRMMFDQVMAWIAGRFRRVEPRTSARAYLLGLLSQAERKNCWQLAEQAGHARPGPMQRLLRYARWDADALRDDVRTYAVDHLGTDDGVLSVDETGFLKKGRASAGVQRQYTGTAGRIETSQVGVFLAYATSRGRALIDRRLYLPEESWCTDHERRQAAGIPGTVRFATKPRLAWEMIAAALDAGVEAAWVTGDEAYGQDPQLRAALEARGTGYVLAVACSTRVRINHGRTPVCADTLAERLPATSWQRQSAGPGAKGQRYYDWAWIYIGVDEHRHLFIRRNRTSGDWPSTCAGHPPRRPFRSCGTRGQCPLERRGVLPGREEPSRTRPLPGQALDLMAPAHHTRRARSGLPVRRRRRCGTEAARRSAPLSSQQRTDLLDRPRDPPPAYRSLRSAGLDCRQASALVNLAQTPPSGSPP